MAKGTESENAKHQKACALKRNKARLSHAKETLERLQEKAN